MHRFYWIVPNVLAGSSRPGRNGDLHADLTYLREQGIGAVLTLTETALDSAALDDFDLISFHLPIDDMTAPQPVHFAEALAFIDDQRIAGRPTVVHCLEGQGRAGSILAAWLIRQGSTPSQALAHLRHLCPGAVENADQEAALDRFAAEMPWLV